MKRICRTAVFAALGAMALFLGPAAQACSCADPGRPCRAFSETDSVFVGRVTSVQEITLATLGYKNRLVKYEVLEAFKGAPGKTIEVATGHGGGDCGIGFRVGDTYLVYAHYWKEAKHLYTGICTRTRALREAGDDLAYLRTRYDPKRGAGIEGQIERLKRHTNGDTEWDGWMSGVRVAVRNTAGGGEATTDAKGQFRVWGLAPGTYTVNATLPPGFVGDTIENVPTRVGRCGEVRILAVPAWKPPAKASRPPG